MKLSNHLTGLVFNRKTATAAISTLLAAAPAFAGDEVPFKGYFVPTVVSVTPVDQTHVRLELSVKAQTTLLGKAEGAAWAIMDVTTFTYVGATEWFGTAKDSIQMTFQGQFALTETAGIRQNIETLQITGGTGRFQGAAGSGVAGGFLDAQTLVPLGKGAPFVALISSPGGLQR